MYGTIGNSKRLRFIPVVHVADGKFCKNCKKLIADDNYNGFEFPIGTHVAVLGCGLVQYSGSVTAFIRSCHHAMG